MNSMVLTKNLKKLKFLTLWTPRCSPYEWGLTEMAWLGYSSSTDGVSGLLHFYKETKAAAAKAVTAAVYTGQVNCTSGNERINLHFLVYYLAPLIRVYTRFIFHEI